MNEQIAVSGTSALVLDTDESKNLDVEVTAIERQAMAMEVKSDLAFASAGELTKRVKTMQKRVEEYWEPMRASTYKAYKSVTDHKSTMLKPLQNAEKILKKKLGDYTREQERIAREQEEQRRREAQVEIDRKLAEAAELETKGDVAGADFAMAEAEVYDQYAANMSIEPKKPKVSGISSTKTWRIKSVDPSKVPISFAGVELRPVDTAAVLRLIKASKGQIAIPGIEIEEDYTMSVRS